MKLLETHKELFIFLNTIFIIFINIANKFDLLLLVITFAVIFAYLYETSFLKLKYLMAFVAGFFINEVYNNSRFIDLPLNTGLEKIGFIVTFSLSSLIFVTTTLYILDNKKINNVLKL